MVVVGFPVGGEEWADESEVGVVNGSYVAVCVLSVLGGGGVRVAEAR